jgi:transcription factor TFIIIB component B''
MYSFFAVDIQTLARMTGKDFSGPVPQIHARTALTLQENPNPNPAQIDPDVDERSSTSAVGDQNHDEGITDKGG